MAAAVVGAAFTLILVQFVGLWITGGRTLRNPTATPAKVSHQPVNMCLVNDDTSLKPSPTEREPAWTTN